MNFRYSKKKSCFISFFTFILLLLSRTGNSQVKTWEGTIVIPTYGWEEDVNPKFWANGRWCQRRNYSEGFNNVSI